MTPRFRAPSSLVVFFVLSFAAGGAQAYTETTDGEFSADPLAPTPVDVAPGSNLFTGSVAAPEDVRDYWTFTIDPGELLTAIQLVSSEDGTTGGAPDRGFIALHPGATAAIPGGSTIGGFLGGDHLDAIDAGTDVLLNLAGAPLGGTGFTAPLGPGDYAFLIQQTSGQIIAYTFDFVVIPEPGTALLLGLGLAGLSARRRR
ncbi:MAG: PEP-CTERM sorting domain-containing protein [bacterium]|nr:PEP-CTERM sorting domain-containing protein [bacterium]